MMDLSERKPRTLHQAREVTRRLSYERNLRDRENRGDTPTDAERECRMVRPGLKPSPGSSTASLTGSHQGRGRGTTPRGSRGSSWTWSQSQAEPEGVDYPRLPKDFRRCGPLPRTVEEKLPGHACTGLAM